MRAADRPARPLGHVVPGPLPVRVRAWDGSVAGTADAPDLAGASPAFPERRMGGVDQIRAVRPTREGASDMPATPAAWHAPASPA
ncbi:hypothetical protein GCM10017562_56200 [Streptomyces roseofulvus]|uniref:Uncharacterized protein n=2 Tax=Streptomyces TaxID=1883 RepID=A0ABU4K9X3_9ACTN|nr:hypothetical protein [Streptomyces roseolus]MDX2294558.1 hypothetical protein [Streptomyces roseolus]